MKTIFDIKIVSSFNFYFFIIIPVYPHSYGIILRYFTLLLIFFFIFYGFNLIFCVPPLMHGKHIKNYLRLRLSCVVLFFYCSIFSCRASARLLSNAIIVTTTKKHAVLRSHKGSCRSFATWRFYFLKVLGIFRDFLSHKTVFFNGRQSFPC